MALFKILQSVDADSTLPDYKTKQQSVQRLKSFEACAKAIKEANEVIISTRLEERNFNQEVEKYRQELTERIEHAQFKIKTMQTHIEDIVKEAFPSASINPDGSVDWNGVTAPDQLEDVVFDPPPVPTEET